jgi:hypothetical protein
LVHDVKNMYETESVISSIFFISSLTDLSIKWFRFT